MSLMTITPDIANAIGRDAGEQSMKAGGRTKWNQGDYNAAARKNNELIAIAYNDGTPEGAEIAARIRKFAA